MAKVILKEQKAMKEHHCQTCEKVIPVGQKYWALKSFRRKSCYCLEHKPSEDTVNNFAPKSRADRASDAATDLRNLAEEMRVVAEELNNLEDKPDEKILGEILKGFNSLSEPDFSEVESLAEEMRSWADNMSGTSLESTSKYEEIDEAASSLENIDTGVSLPTWSNDDPQETASSLEEAASSLDDAADELESVDFPRAF